MLLSLLSVVSCFCCQFLLGIYQILISPGDKPLRVLFVSGIIKLRIMNGSERGITFSLNPEYIPTSGGSQLIIAFSPLWTSTFRSVGGSGAVVMLAVHVSQSVMLVLE